MLQRGPLSKLYCMFILLLVVAGVLILVGWRSLFQELQRQWAHVVENGSRMSTAREETWGAQVDGYRRLPDWRMTTDCSSYSTDCVLRRVAERRQYADYPFKMIGSDYDHLYKWQAELPEGWFQSLKENIPTDAPRNHSKQTPPTCAETLLEAHTAPVDKQLLGVVSRLRPVDGWLSYSILDDSYAHDMMQDVHEMVHNIMGFNDAFFIVALDNQTIVQACQHGYPFIAWHEEKGDPQALKNVVAKAKFGISLKLIKQGHAFFFFEMDLWFVKSPLHLLRKQTADAVFSGHQDNPEAANIGAFSFLANNATEEYFRLCLDIFAQTPETHDQRIMQMAIELSEQRRGNLPLRYTGSFEKLNLSSPTIQSPIRRDMFSVYEIAASEIPLVTENILAIRWTPDCEQ